MLHSIPTSVGLVKLIETFRDREQFYIVQHEMSQGNLVEVLLRMKVPLLTEKELLVGARCIC